MGRTGVPLHGRGGVFRHVASALDTRADSIAADIAGRIASSIPGLPYDPSLVASCWANVRLGFGMLRDGVPGERAVPPPDACQYAHEVAHRGRDVQALLAAYRLGCGSLWRCWSEAVSERVTEPAELLPVLDRSATFMLGYHEALTSRIRSEFEVERNRCAPAPVDTAKVVQALLTDAAVDARAAARTLGYPLSAHHLGVAIAHGETSVHDVQALVAELARAARASTTLLVAEGDAVSAWLGHGERLDTERAAESARRLAREHTLDIGLGDADVGLDGFRRTHAEAREALRVATLGGRHEGRLARYAQVAVASLLSVDDARAWRFVERTLGELAADDDATARLRATLRVFFAEGLSQARTARRLGLHHNTVAYRLRRAEELLGRPLEERRLELEVALTLASAFGEGRTLLPEARRDRGGLTV